MDGRYLKEDDQVMSEVHLGCPPETSGPHISCFSVHIPSETEIRRFHHEFTEEEEEANRQQTVSQDEDGDLVLRRRHRQCTGSFRVTIHHMIASSIPKVGLQLWKAELVLADFVLHTRFTSSDFDGIVSLELGAGTGLAGILLADVAKTVFLTDYGDEVLDNCTRNLHLNNHVLNHGGAVHVRELDWMSCWPPSVHRGNSGSEERYSWTFSDVEEVEKASVLLAADVIYDDYLTDVFFRILEKLMSFGQKKVLYLAMEKRYNFSLDDLEVVANGYSRFLSYVKDEKEYADPRNEFMGFVGKCMDLTLIPQYVREYKRDNDVELWEIKCARR